MTIQVRDGLGVSGRLEIRLFDVPELEAADSGWSDRSREDRHEILTEDPPVEPRRVIRSENLILDNYLEILARGAETDPSHLAVGDGTTAPDPSNDTLNNETYRTTVGQDEQDGLDRITSTLLGQNEANGLAIREVGLATGPVEGAWTLLTHVVLSDADQVEQKDSSTAITIDYILEFRRPA